MSRWTEILNPHTKKLERVQDVGGECGLTGRGYYTRVPVHDDFTLVPGRNTIYRWVKIYPNDTDINITLDMANAKQGDRFIIKNDSPGNSEYCLIIKQGAAIIDKIYAQVIKEFIYADDSPTGVPGWTGASLGTHPETNYAGIGIGENADPHECGVAIGQMAKGYYDAVAIGTSANGYQNGVAIGYTAQGNNDGVAIGEGAIGHHSGVALGNRCDTDEKLASIALGYRSKNTRYAELAINIGDEIGDDMRDQLQQIVIGSWVRKTTDATPVSMSVNGTTIFTIRPQSALTFKIMVTARDNTSGDCAGYLFDGLIKRDGSNNTTLCASNKTILHEDDDTWDCDIAAAGTTLQITVTGDADNLVRWAARLDGVETSFVAA